mgnify:FL=1
MPIERTPQNSSTQDFIEQNLRAQSPFLTEADDQPIEITVGPEDGEEVASIEYDEVEAPSFDANLAEFIDDSELQSIASDLIDDFESDKASRKEWEETYKSGLDLLGIRIEERSEPWDGACGVFHPMLTEAVIRFQSEMISETFPAQGPVKARIVGKADRDTERAAARVVADMNYQLTEKMIEFRPEHEKMLWSLALAGASFKKVYFDPSLNRQVSMFIPAEDIFLSYGASDANNAERITHLMRKTKNEVRKLQYAGFYRDVELQEPTKDITDIQKRKDEDAGYSAVKDDRYQLLEMQIELDLPGFEDMDPETEEPTGIALPYIVTLEKSTNTVLAVRRNWDEHDELKQPRQHIVQYTYIPNDSGPYGYGLIHLIGGFAKGATSILRQLVDAGTLSNLPGGFKTKGLRVKGDDTPIMPGEFRDVDVASGTMRDNIMPLPYKEPSATLFQLLQNIVDEARRLAAVADVDFNKIQGEAPVGTTLAILERTLKVMSAVQARVHASMAQEFKLIAALIRDYTAPTYSYIPDDHVGASAKREDYEQTDIIPVSDPNATTMAQRIIQYQAAIQLAQQAPQIYNLPLLHRQMLEVMGIKDADKIVETEEDFVPTDPVTENMQLLKLKGAKAFIDQNHEAHIAVHNAFIQNPLLAQQMGQNPQAQAIMQAFQAHLAEHMGFLYRKQIELALGVPLPSPDEEMSPELEAQIAPLLAQASQTVLANSQQIAQAQAAQQAAQDPIVQQQQKELQLKMQELADKKEIEMAKIQKDLIIANKAEGTKVQVQSMKDKSASFQVGFNAVKDQMNRQSERDHGAAEKDKDRQFSAVQAATKGGQE